MSQSLRDQLVKAGLATSAQAKKAERSKRAEATAERQQGKSTKGKKGKGGQTSAPQSESDMPKLTYVNFRRTKADIGVKTKH